MNLLYPRLEGTRTMVEGSLMREGKRD
ncbi:hypothetical protein Gotri_002329, partial [Gossypium trilobum]|nr:hypothetical protein [Gossypium trilobum]